MRTAVVTVVHGRHDHLARQLAGLEAKVAALEGSTLSAGAPPVLP